MKRPIIVAWDPAFSVGDSQLDEDHRYLLTITNKLYVAEAGVNAADVEACLSSLISYAIRHFHREESYMRRIGYRDFHYHKTLHDEFIVKVQQFHDEFGKDASPAISGDISKFLAAWWKDHILHEDQKYADFHRDSLQGG